ncbi:GNAT family N-acetyltransferase [Microbacterium sp. W4I20]|uniref:GNAT family N-acetyltransferase n=1 Tax=Microbacterium sp. W4I20 TaxID=3042262 RepID=UPI002785010E|nr:GNAT family N-acetyltransferase [Microbacterium sp. W4I20]MDQ0729162.1 GNAT superfamily N-acetyltransferase [Microbacterium sp. W4I20]
MQLEPVGLSNATTTFDMMLVDPASSVGRAVIRRFFKEIVGRYWGREATDVEVEQAMLDEPSDDLRGDTGFLVIVRDGERVVGCGGAKVVEPGIAELTRVFVDDSVRGLGTGKALVREIEALSARRGVHTLRLTVREDLAEAHRLYRQLGYKPVPPFSTSPYADNQLAKVLLESR